MKKMRFAVLFAAFASVLGFSSCLDNGNDGPQQNVSMVTVNDYMGFSRLIPDESQKQSLIPTDLDLTKYGIKSTTKRAMISYTIPEGQDLTAKEVKINMIAGQEWQVLDVSSVADTCKDYTSPIMKFSNYSVGYYVYPAINVVQDRYLNLGFVYKADKLAKLCMLPNRASNDTVYLDLKVKKTGTLNTPLQMTSFDLHSRAFFELKHQAKPVQDSIYVTVVASTSMYNDNDMKKDSVTVRCRRF